MKQTNVISIVAGGKLYKKFLPLIRSADMVIGVDRGALWLIKEVIVPDLSIGDFDSVTVAEKKIIHAETKRYMEFSPQKDATDLELALEEAMKLHPKDVRIFGSIGNRMDHTFVAVNLLQKLVSHNINGEIVDNFNKINIVRHQQKISRAKEFRYVSVLPLGLDATITLTGFMYNVVKTKFNHDSSLGVSNEILDTFATITVHQGTVLVIRSKD